MLFFKTLEVLSLLFSAAGVVITLINPSEEQKIVVSISIALFIILFVISCLCLWRQWRISKRAKTYIREHSHLTKAISTNADLIRNIKTHKKKNFSTCENDLDKICLHIADCISKLSKGNIHVCLKLSQIENPKKPYAITLARSTSSKEERDRRERYNHPKGRDYVADNTDFQSIALDVINKRPIENIYYKQNCLPWKWNYENSHIPDGHRKAYKKWNGLYVQITKWCLPYKSSISVPIIKDLPQNSENYPIYGYLCADSDCNFGFTNEYGLKALQEMAPLLEETLRLVGELKNKVPS